MNLKSILFGCYNGKTCCRWGKFDHSKVGDQIRWNVVQKIEWFQDLPRNLRWWTANTLSKWAHRLRGGKSYDFGYGVRENRAAHLESNLRLRFIPAPQGIDEEDAGEALAEIEELGALAHATSWILNFLDDDE